MPQLVILHQRIVGIFQRHSLLIYITENHACGISDELSSLMKEKGRFMDLIPWIILFSILANNFRTRN